MSTADPTAYDWLHEDLAWFGEAACVTVASGVTREPFVNAFGVDLASPQSRADSASTPDDVDGPALISFTEVAGCLVAVEVNGSTGSEADVLEATSITGRAASAFWDVNGMVRFACARDGQMLYDGEFAPEGMLDGIEGLPPVLVGLVELVADDLKDDDAEVGAAVVGEQPSFHAVAMALVEAWTGARVSAADIERALTLGYVAES